MGSLAGRFSSLYYLYLFNGPDVRTIEHVKYWHWGSTKKINIAFVYFYIPVNAYFGERYPKYSALLWIFFLKLTAIHRLNQIQMSQELTILCFNTLITLLTPLLKAILMSAALRDRYLLSWTLCISSVCSDPTSTSPFLFTDTYIITCLALSWPLTSTEIMIQRYSMSNYSSCCR